MFYVITAGNALYSTKLFKYMYLWKENKTMKQFTLVFDAADGMFWLEYECPMFWYEGCSPPE